MAVKLSKEQLEHLKNYKYVTSEWTFLDNKYNHFWEFTVNCLPRNIAPNLITLCGAIMPIVAFIHQCQYDLSFSTTLPASVFILNAFSMFWFQTLDAIDGKQARRTGNTSCLGQLLDHNMDQFSYSFFTVHALAMIKARSDYWVCFMVTMGQLTPHFTIEYHKHFTNFHKTVTETAGGIKISITEQLLIMYSL